MCASCLVLGVHISKDERILIARSCEVPPHWFYLHKDLGSAVRLVPEKSNVVTFLSNPKDDGNSVIAVLTNNSVVRFFKSLMELGSSLRLEISFSSKPD